MNEQVEMATHREGNVIGDAAVRVVRFALLGLLRAFLAYGLGATAIWVLGLPHGMAVMHGRRGAADWCSMRPIS
jgi:hypothetical protein